MSLNDDNAANTPSLQDVKPSVGHIPEPVVLPPPSLGRNFFKVELLVGGNKQPMLPFSQTTVSDAPLSIDKYVSTSGLPFAIRVKLNRPRTDGCLYGARVYVDEGNANKETVYREWVNPDSGPYIPSDTVDDSRADHYFWFEEGQTEHVIDGFYVSEEESAQFIFREPRRKKMRLLIPNFGEVIDKLGVIRIVFCSVSHFENNRGPGATVSPKQARIDSRLDRKVQLTAKPGRVFRDGCKRAAREAVLSKEIIYERRLVYNSFEGFNAKNTFMNCHDKLSFFKGMPLEALLLDNVRMWAVLAFCRKVSETRFDIRTDERLQRLDEGETLTQAQGSTNDYIRVEDMVHFICQNLSPAASYIICTGKCKRGNYGEVSVQKCNASRAEQLQDYYDKERGLVGFFMTEPGQFDLELVDIDPKKHPKENYKVRITICEIQDSSDEE